MVGGLDNFLKMYKQIHKEKYQLMYIKLSENPAQVFHNFETKIYPNSESHPEELDLGDI